MARVSSRMVTLLACLAAACFTLGSALPPLGAAGGHKIIADVAANVAESSNRDEWNMDLRASMPKLAGDEGEAADEVAASPVAADDYADAGDVADSEADSETAADGVKVTMANPKTRHVHYEGFDGVEHAFEGEVLGIYSILETPELVINGIISPRSRPDSDLHQFVTVSMQTRYGARVKFAATPINRRMGADKGYIAVSVNDVYPSHKPGTVHQSLAKDVTIVIQGKQNVQVHTPGVFMDIALESDGTLSLVKLTLLNEPTKISGILSADVEIDSLEVANALGSDIANEDEYRVDDLWSSLTNVNIVPLNAVNKNKGRKSLGVLDFHQKFQKLPEKGEAVQWLGAHPEADATYANACVAYECPHPEAA